MKALMKKLEALQEKGGMKKDIALLAVSGAALLMSIFRPFPTPVDPAWAAIVLCGVPIVLAAMIGLITAFDIKADVLVSLALIASVCIGETFAAGEVAFIMQLGALLEEMTVARPGGHRAACTAYAADGARAGRGRRARRSRGAGANRRPAARAARRDDSGRRRDCFRADVRQPGGDDGRIAAGG